jgi:multiple antibiotic resistance protein
MSSEFLRFAASDAAGTAVLGHQILALFGISAGSFRIAGGIIILILALSMLQAQQSGIHHSAQEEDAGKAKDNRPSSRSRSR